MNDRVSESCQLNMIDSRISQLENQLASWQEFIKEQRVPEEATSCDPRVNRKLSIVVIGASRVEGTILQGIAKTIGLEAAQLELRLGYEAIDRSLIDHLRWNAAVAGILCGPVPHSAGGASTDPIAFLSGSDFPPLVRLKVNAGSLKISKTAFRDGLQQLLELLADENQNHPSSPSRPRPVRQEPGQVPDNKEIDVNQLNPALAVRTIEYLLSVQRSKGDLNQAFARIHHMPNESIERHLAYLRRIKHYRGARNADVLRRLLVMKRGAGDLLDRGVRSSVGLVDLVRLAEEAVASFPVDDLPRRGE